MGRTIAMRLQRSIVRLIEARFWASHKEDNFVIEPALAQASRALGIQLELSIQAEDFVVVREGCYASE